MFRSITWTPQKSKSVLMRVAADFRLHLVIGFSSSPAHRGGCLILTDEATLPHVKNLQERPSVVRAKSWAPPTHREAAKQRQKPMVATGPGCFQIWKD